MNNDKLTQAVRKVGEEANLFGEWCTEQFTAMTDVVKNVMASYGISADEAADVLISPLKMFKRQKYLEEKYKRIRNVPEGKSNNWLKAHGYPMRREIVGRRGNKKHKSRNSDDVCTESGSEDKRRSQDTEGTEPSVPGSHGGLACSQGNWPDDIQRVSEFPETSRGAVCSNRTGTGRVGGNQSGSSRRRKYSGGWPARKR